jgi:small subunit ribosomal protein S4
MATKHRGFRRKGYDPEKVQDGRRPRRLSEYGLQLREKQNLKAAYGILEKQFRRYIKQATSKEGVTADLLVQALEQRLDNVIYRAGFAITRNQARQTVSHRHVMVNGRIVNVASFGVRPGDVVEIKEKSREIVPIVQAIASSSDSARPEWLQVDVENRRATVVGVPDAEKVDTGADMKRVIEFYSR